MERGGKAERARERSKEIKKKGKGTKCFLFIHLLLSDTPAAAIGFFPLKPTPN